MDHIFIIGGVLEGYDHLIVVALGKVSLDMTVRQYAFISLVMGVSYGETQ